MGTPRLTTKSELPTLRWGIIGAGLISSWFVQDITLERDDGRANHIITAIGSSSLEKGKTFVDINVPTGHSAGVYASYREVYNDPNVDIVYIGTPHALHKQNCLDAIEAGKHVLCEKAFTITAKEGKEVIAAAKARGVFLMEAMWLRFRPLVVSLREKLFKEKVIGDVLRVFCDFSMEMNVRALGQDSRLKNPALGAGSLLDIGMYSITWALLTLEDQIDHEGDVPQIAALQKLRDGIDIATTILLQFPATGRQAILSSSLETKTDASFCRIEGTDGYIEVQGVAASAPSSFTVYPKNVISQGGTVARYGKGSIPTTGDHYEFTESGKGFWHEADAVAVDIAAGRLENETMPHCETIKVMDIMDEVRRQGGARFAQDDE